MASATNSTPNAERFIDLRIHTQIPGNAVLQIHGIKATSTIAELKEHVRLAVPSRPAAASLKFIYRGHRIRNDADTIERVLTREAVEQQTSHTLHLVIQDSHRPFPATTPAHMPLSQPTSRPGSTDPRLRGGNTPQPHNPHLLPRAAYPMPQMPQMQQHPQAFQHAQYLQQAHMEHMRALQAQLGGAGGAGTPFGGYGHQANMPPIQVPGAPQPPQPPQPTTDIESGSALSQLQASADRLRQQTQALARSLEPPGNPLPTTTLEARSANEQGNAAVSGQSLETPQAPVIQGTSSPNAALSSTADMQRQASRTPQHSMPDSAAPVELPPDSTSWVQTVGPNGTVRWTTTMHAVIRAPSAPQSVPPTFAGPFPQMDIPGLHVGPHPLLAPGQSMPMSVMPWLSASHAISTLNDLQHNIEESCQRFWELNSSRRSQHNQDELARTRRGIAAEVEQRNAMQQHQLARTNIVAVIERRNAIQQTVNNVLSYGPPPGHTQPNTEEISQLQALSERFTSFLDDFTTQNQAGTPSRAQSSTTDAIGNTGTDRTDAYLLNSANGPCGIVYTHEGVFGTTAASQTGSSSQNNEQPPQQASRVAELNTNGMDLPALLSTITQSRDALEAQTQRLAQLNRSVRESLDANHGQPPSSSSDPAVRRAYEELNADLDRELETFRILVRNSENAMHALQQQHGFAADGIPTIQAQPQPPQPPGQRNADPPPFLQDNQAFERYMAGLDQNIANINAQPHAHAHAHGPAPANANNRNVRVISINLMPFLQTLWFFIRIYGVMWILLGGVDTRLRMVVLCAASAVYWAIQAGIGREYVDQAGRYWDGLVGEAPRGAANAAAPAVPGAANAGTPQANGNTAGAGAQAPPAQAQAQPRHPIREALRPVEEVLTLLLASLWPGVGERRVAETRRQQEEEERRQRELRTALEELERATRGLGRTEEGAPPDTGESAAPGTTAADPSSPSTKQEGPISTGTAVSASSSGVEAQQGEGAVTARRPATGGAEGTEGAAS